jgi:hypothetical protein
MKSDTDNKFHHNPKRDSSRYEVWMSKWEGIFGIVKQESFSLLITSPMFYGITLQMQNMRFYMAGKKHDRCDMSIELK